jgi:hypothetical protein
MVVVRGKDWDSESDSMLGCELLRILILATALGRSKSLLCKQDDWMVGMTIITTCMSTPVSIEDQ